MTEKCKLNDLAKDLGVSNKELIDLIEARFGEQKKATAVLVDQELNYVVEYYSKTVSYTHLTLPTMVRV